jgi:hypothetical protein
VTQNSSAWELGVCGFQPVPAEAGGGGGGRAGGSRSFALDLPDGHGGGSVWVGSCVHQSIDHRSSLRIEKKSQW